MTQEQIQTTTIDIPPAKERLKWRPYEMSNRRMRNKVGKARAKGKRPYRRKKRFYPPVIFTYTETYSPSVANFMEEWIKSVAPPEPVVELDPEVPNAAELYDSCKLDIKQDGVWHKVIGESAIRLNFNAYLILEEEDFDSVLRDYAITIHGKQGPEIASRKVIGVGRSSYVGFYQFFTVTCLNGEFRIISRFTVALPSVAGCEAPHDANGLIAYDVKFGSPSTPGESNEDTGGNTGSDSPQSPQQP